MFTGIIEDIGEIVEIQKREKVWKLRIRTSLAEDLKTGDSICVDGVCLTVIARSRDQFESEVSFETLKVTTFSEKKVGDRVNLERSLQAPGRFHGHIVTGHVDCVGKIIMKTREGDSILLEIEVPHDASKYIVKKGSIAVDGISLTVNDQSDNKFRVNIVPYTASHTTIARKGLGEKVNIELDIIAKYVERFVSEKRSGIDYEFLIKHGYIKG